MGVPVRRGLRGIFDWATEEALSEVDGSGVKEENSNALAWMENAMSGGESAGDWADALSKVAYTAGKAIASQSSDAATKATTAAGGGSTGGGSTGGGSTGGGSTGGGGVVRTTSKTTSASSSSLSPLAIAAIVGGVVVVGGGLYLATRKRGPR